jgi:competence protein ComEC
MLQFSEKKVYTSLTILFLIAIFLWSQVLTETYSNEIDVNFYNVGQGDAIHIRNNKNQDILIDGGPDSKIIEKLDQYMPFYDDKIELVILTHPHADHLTGLIHVLEKYKVEQVLYTDISYDSSVFLEWRKLVKEKGIKEIFAKFGQIVKLNKANLYILFPYLNYNGKNVKELNNTSIVSKLVYENSSFLFTGDAEKEAEKELIDQVVKNREILKSDLIKIGHHGSNTASTKEFLSIVNPLYAVISVGLDNKFQHPHQETISKINDLDIELFRTDQDGDVKCTTDGQNIKCNTKSK